MTTTTSGGRPPYGVYELVLYTLLIWILVLTAAVVFAGLD